MDYDYDVDSYLKGIRHGSRKKITFSGLSEAKRSNSKSVKREKYISPKHKKSSSKTVEKYMNTIDNDNDLKNENKVQKSAKKEKNIYVLVDANMNQMKTYFPKVNFNYKNNNGKFIQPLPLYGPREQNCIFYFSEQYSNSFKEGLNSFAEKFPFIKAKKKINTQNLQKELKRARKFNKFSDYMFNDRESYLNLLKEEQKHKYNVNLTTLSTLPTETKIPKIFKSLVNFTSEDEEK